ncbi:MAG: heavy metal translocating P-type ATPase [Ectothiorhodospiraceae bacterium]|jgi:Cu2+-exporting ATPase|nr:heavy metal translocating P-type ATPase [Ectothiorhodospiraceae bacterium]
MSSNPATAEPQVGTTAAGEDTTENECFHCGLPLPRGAHYPAEVLGETREMCCPGCQAVAQAIVAGGLADYYRYRTEKAGIAGVPDALRDLELYDRPELQQGFVQVEPGNLRDASLILEGIVCAACVWLNERHVKTLPGVVEFTINFSTHRARLRWDDSRIHLSDILKAIAAIGYRAHPFDPGRQEAVYKRERAVALRRLAVAGLGAMQIMMLATALWVGEGDETHADMIRFMRWVCFVVATPVVFYSGITFHLAAWRDLRQRRLGMDVPVSLAILSTYFASAWATITDSGTIYFESAAMFVFLLLAGRFLEMNARHRAGQATEALAKLLPPFAIRLTDEDGEETVPVTDLAPGDRVRLRPGDIVPADGMVIEGRSSTNEAMLTGESLPRLKAAGDSLTGGTVNVESPLLMRVEKVGAETTLSAIQRLLDRAQSEKPDIARLAERGTGWFILLVLLLAAGSGLAWWHYVDPARAFWVAISVMVISCPCALALAAPVAITAATGTLARLGVLTTRGHALETLAQATHIVFDKTGTLTEGRLHLESTRTLGGMSEADCLALAAALEVGSEHPVAQVFQRGDAGGRRAEELFAVAGNGMEGRVNGLRYRIGTPAFVAELAGDGLNEHAQTIGRERSDVSVVVLGNEHGPLALFLLADRLRPDAPETILALRRLGLEPWLLSGDGEAPVARIAGQLGITNWRAALTPEGKLAQVEALQRQGAVVAMVGDGVNDAPVLSRAHVSVAMAGGSQLAHASADMLLLSERLPHLLAAVGKARDTLRIIRQNVGWALAYNGIGLPLAAAGLVTPWIAALGMSMSSLIVVVNALRLNEVSRASRGAPAEPSPKPSEAR